MNMEEVIENELKCVQRNCCRLENECAKCDLVLPIEEIINAYNEALRSKKENKELKRQVEQKQHLADVRLEQSLENYKLFSDERKARIDVDIALDDTTDQLTYAKTIIQDLLDNTDEYARQRAEDFLKEVE